MRVVSLALAAALSLSAPAFAEEQNPQIDYDGFVELTMQLAETRQQHLLSFQDFTAMQQSEGAILLDTRSAKAFEEGHLAGAINLPFSDFTEGKLAKVLGDNMDRPILIYCNNNFRDNIRPVMTKKATLALNIPTFINLHGYGYTNVWELSEIVMMDDVDWVRPEATG
ncbi:rhodanese-like domain-containing protein [Altererythrobacter sp. ZODW24]|uniref:rhodanese-like domain-containing protein n=1 Tax=Altererythrobacter sp. ZODW24 TaxID=2185142 RepID=UPI000DF79045|nr:rhodanese-like domain-containing protein [Altererythrobacter sp. ZODW24]